jgi:hypothetical protein
MSGAGRGGFVPFRRFLDSISRRDVRQFPVANLTRPGASGELF